MCVDRPGEDRVDAVAQGGVKEGLDDARETGAVGPDGDEGEEAEVGLRLHEAFDAGREGLVVGMRRDAIGVECQDLG